jgi:RHS repeat-associated protein
LLFENFIFSRKPLLTLQSDHDLGLYFNRARYLDVNRGRFWSQDSFEGYNEEPQSLHKYTYSENNPVGKIDPSGNSARLVVFAAIALILTVLSTVSTVNAPRREDPTYRNDFDQAVAGTCAALAVGGAVFGGARAIFARFVASRNNPFIITIFNNRVPFPVKPKAPFDASEFTPIHATSRPLSPYEAPGEYVYVRDRQYTVHIAENGPSRHPQVLGGGRKATGAGTIKIDPDGTITEITNFSGHFQFPGNSVLSVRQSLLQQGFKVQPDACKPFEF